jgi:hypothetical protein
MLRSASGKEEIIMKQRTIIGLAAIVAIVFGAAWKFGETPTFKRAPIKNLVKEGDLEGTLAVGRQLIAQLAANNWNWSAVDQSLLAVPDQYNYQFAPDAEGTYTWSPCPREEYQDEVAFFSLLYTWKSVEVVPGIEGRLHVTGDIIVGWKDGRVETVPVGDARMYPVAEAKTYIYVFPGMNEYDAELPRDGDPDFSEKIANFKAKRKA